MDSMGPGQFILLLHSVPFLGEVSLARVLRWNAQNRLSPEEFLALPSGQLERECGLDARATAYLTDCRDQLLRQSAEDARLLRARRVETLTLLSAAYPDRLQKNEEAPPPILYCLGNLPLLQNAGQQANRAFTFALAVSNGASSAALDLLDEIVTELTRAGGIPITGHDRTAYQRAALASQRQGLPTIFVLDRGMREALGPGLDRPPFAAARIRDTVFDTNRDLAISSFRLDDHGIGANNRRRDRLIFSLADIIIALDVQAGGGMATECRRMWEQGMPVLVAEGGRGGNESLRSLGCPTLLPQGDRVEHVRAVLTARNQPTGNLSSRM